jgi:hypothetical protein
MSGAISIATGHVVMLELFDNKNRSGATGTRDNTKVLLSAESNTVRLELSLIQSTRSAVNDITNYHRLTELPVRVLFLRRDARTYMAVASSSAPAQQFSLLY